MGSKITLKNNLETEFKIEHKDGEEAISLTSTQLQNKLNEYVNVKDYGVGIDALDAYIASTTDTINVVLDKDYVYDFGTLEGIKYSLDGYKKVHIDFNGATLYSRLALNDVVDGKSLKIFKFTNCTNIELHNCHIENEFKVTESADLESYKNRAGIQLAYFEDYNEFINIHNITGNQLFGICEVRTSLIAPLAYSSQTKNITLRDINLTNVVYGFNGAFNGSDVIIDNMTIDGTHRAIYVYGVQNYDINLDIINANYALRLATFQGSVLKNIRANVHADITSSTTISSDFITFVGTKSATGVIRDIELNLNMNLNGIYDSAVAFIAQDTGSLPTYIDNVTITGHIENSGGRAFSVTDATYLKVGTVKYENIVAKTHSSQCELIGGYNWDKPCSIKNFYLSDSGNGIGWYMSSTEQGTISIDGLYAASWVTDVSATLSPDKLCIENSVFTTTNSTLISNTESYLLNSRLKNVFMDGKEYNNYMPNKLIYHPDYDVLYNLGSNYVGVYTDMQGSSTYSDGRFQAHNINANNRIYIKSQPSASTNAVLDSIIGSTRTAAILANGDYQSATNSYGSTSDIKLKENIVATSPKLDDLMKVKIKNFNYIGSELKQIGVIAQELEEVFPGLVYETDDIALDDSGNEVKTGEVTKNVKYSVFIPMLIKAIQELRAEIDVLRGAM